MQVLNKNTQFLFNVKPNLDKRATEDKMINFSKESEYYTAKSRALYRNWEQS